MCGIKKNVLRFNLNVVKVFIAAWLCMIVASGVICPSPAYIEIGAPIGLAGAALFVLAFDWVEEAKP